ncbi:MAG: response regulator [Planctomycetes bacterium]|nr:response regulator [Planctomycetota bacterium]
MGKKVLIADDSAMMRKIIMRDLKAAGMVAEVVEASDGEEALALFQAGGFHLVLTDWNMPAMDGLTLVKRIRASDKAVGIVMITTNGSPEKAKEAALAGANNLLAKPFSPQALKDKLGKFLV